MPAAHYILTQEGGYITKWTQVGPQPPIPDLPAAPPVGLPAAIAAIVALRVTVNTLLAELRAAKVLAS